jgi:hypothetical protein
MTTQNPRLTITLQPSLAAQLRKLSQLTGNSQSSLISELLDGSAPVFDRMILVLTAAESAKASLRGHLSTDMAQAQARIEKQLGLALEDFDSASQPVLNEFEVIQRRGRKGAGRGALATARTLPDAKPTPLSNRGVRSLTNTIKKVAAAPTPAKSKPIKRGANRRGVES